MKIEIIYEDKDILVIYKPAGLATQTAKIGQADVVSELKNYLKIHGQQSPYLGVIHRLDQPVEGLLVFAKTKAAAASLTSQLQKQGDGGLNKHYYAVVCGKPAADEGELVDYMYKSSDNRAVIVEKQPDGGANSQNVREEIPKKAVLRYRTVETMKVTVQAPQAESVILTKVDIQILTGRFHQIRAQMSHAGWPLLGDAKYGSEQAKSLAKQRNVRNVALCAYRLELLHPTTGKKSEFRIEPKGKAFNFS